MRASQDAAIAHPPRFLSDLGGVLSEVRSPLTHRMVRLMHSEHPTVEDREIRSLRNVVGTEGRHRRCKSNADATESTTRTGSRDM